MLSIGFVLDVNRKNLAKVKHEIVKSMSALKYGDNGYVFDSKKLLEETYPVAKIVPMLQQYNYEKFQLWEATIFTSLVLSKDDLPLKKIIAIVDAEIKNKEKPIEFIKNLNLGVDVNFISIDKNVSGELIRNTEIKELNNLIKEIINDGQDI